MDAARELAQLRRLCLSSSIEASISAAASGRPPLPAREAQVQRERDEPRLGAVVEVALEAAALGVAGLDESDARRAQLHQACAQLGVQALVLQQQRGCRAGRADRLLVLDQRAVVDDRGEGRPSRSTSVTARVGSSRAGSSTARAAGVDVTSLLGHPEGEAQPRVAERPGQRAPQVSAGRQVREPRDEAAHPARARDVGPREAREEGERRRRRTRRTRARSAPAPAWRRRRPRAAA